MAAPLTNLLRKDSFHWSVAAANAFLILKHAFMKAPVLSLPDFSKSFILETDTFGSGFGEILSQDSHPIAYFSKKLSQAAQKQSTYAREMQAIIVAISKFRHYLLGHKFIVQTDYKSLKEMQQQVIQTPEQQAWLPKRLGYDFTIEYKRGSENQEADGLSRAFMSFSSLTSPLLQKLQVELQSFDPKMEFTDSELQSGKLRCHQGVWYWCDKLVVPCSSPLIQTILQEFHASKLGGHGGVKKTLVRISSQFYWKHMQKSIKEYIVKCQLCQQAKYSTQPPAGLLEPLPIPSHFWLDIAMDFITGLPRVQGYAVIMVVVDRLSKFAHFIPLPEDYSATKVADAFIDCVVSIRGPPKSIVSDRDKVFISKFWEHLCARQGIVLARSYAYHPQTDGQSEVLNCCLEMYLQCFTHKSKVVYEVFWAF